MSSRTGLRDTARERIRPRRSSEPFRSAADARAFFAACDQRESSGVEPAWEEHLEVINESRSRGVLTTSIRVCTREPRQ